MARTSPRSLSPSLEIHPLAVTPLSLSLESHPLGASPRRSKRPRREESVFPSSSHLTMNAASPSIDSEADYVPQPPVRESRIRYRGSTSSKFKDDNSRAKILNSSSTLLIPSAGLKLAHMLTLIRQGDVEFKQYPDYTQIYFPPKMIGEPSVLYRLKARRLRSLIAHAHHLDEEDRFLKIPSIPVVSLPHSIQPSTPAVSLEAVSLTFNTTSAT